MTKFSLQQSLAGRQLLILGATGFIGKVLLAMFLNRLPDIKHLYLVIRSTSKHTAKERFQEILLHSPVFQSLRDQYGDQLENWIAKRITVINGNIHLPDFGLSQALVQTLQEQIDVVINCAGLVDFFPDLREALSVNIHSTQYIADFVMRCKAASLLHLSTCYVAGKRNGHIPEEPMTMQAPNGLVFDVINEIELIKKMVDQAQSSNEGDEKKLRKQLVKLGIERSQYWGWPNTYTYSKAIAEAWLMQQEDKLNFTIVRPSIVESALAFPFAGWNEGYNTTSPLLHTFGGWYPYLIASPDIPLDVVPVDLVCNAIIKVTAALLHKKHVAIYQCASSAINPLSVINAMNFSRQWYREKMNKKRFYKKIKLTMNLRAISPKHIFSSVQLAKYTHFIPSFIINRLGFLQKMTKSLRRLALLQEVYAPFLHDNRYHFAADAITQLQVLEPEFDTPIHTIDWEHYWIKIHMPGVARWTFTQQKKDNKMSLFVTGTTGYIGSYVSAFLLNDYQDSLNVLVRARSMLEARQRLWQAWQIHYNWEQFSQIINRCHIFLGDITEKQLGLNNDDYQRLIATTTSIIHCAASLNRKSEKTCLNVNLRGTLALIQLARAIQDKSGLRRFSLVSTVAIAGTRLHENVAEDDALDWKRSDYDPYARTKKFSEHMLRELLPDVSTIIFRPSVVLGDSRFPQTTQFDMARAFAFFVNLPLLPFSASARIDIVPVDYAARAIAVTHQTATPKYNTYHLSSGMASLTYRDILNKLHADGYRKRNYFLPWLQKPFNALVNIAANQRKIASISYPASLLKVFLPYMTYDTVFINDRIVQELGKAPASFDQYAYSLLQFVQDNDFNYPYLPYPAI